MAALAAALVALTMLSGCAQLRARASGSSANAPMLASANPTMETQFVASINALRAAHHLRALRVHPVLVNKARHWSWWMAAGICGRAANRVPVICHSSLAGGITVRWSRLTENVGQATPKSGLAGLPNAFAHSAAHLANILDASATYVGIGFAYSGNTGFVTEEFMG